MPELPEVETVARNLQKMVLGRTITQVRVLYGKAVEGATPEEFARGVQGQKISGVGRRGKYLLIDLANGRRLAAHLRLSGRMIVSAPWEPIDKYAQVVFSLDDGQELRFGDVRKFGRIAFLGERECGALHRRLGVEPLSDDFTVEVMAEILRDRKTRIKPLLLDQRFIAGLGNIYVDEALFLAGIHPAREARSISPEEAARLYGAIRRVLAASIANRGTTLVDYRNADGSRGNNRETLLVFRRTGQPCPRCGTAIERLKLGGRGTHICPKCQRE